MNLPNHRNVLALQIAATILFFYFILQNCVVVILIVRASFVQKPFSAQQKSVATTITALLHAVGGTNPRYDPTTLKCRFISKPK